MLEFFHYCFICFCGTFSAAFGNVSDNMTFQMYIVGIITTIVVGIIGLFLLHLLGRLIDGPVDRLIRYIGKIRKR